MNPQISCGDDVVSRIMKCRDESDGLDSLNAMIRDCVNGMMVRMLERVSASGDAVTKLSFTGEYCDAADPL